jgi:hypothetical protein
MNLYLLLTMTKVTSLLCLCLILCISEIQSDQGTFHITNGLTLSGANQIAKFESRSKIQCAIMCFTITSTHWRCQTVHYDGGVCTLYAESTILEGWNGGTTTEYWTRPVCFICDNYYNLWCLSLLVAVEGFIIMQLFFLLIISDIISTH